MENLFQKQKPVSKPKKKKKIDEEISFITWFKIEFLVLFTGCEKALGSMTISEYLTLFSWTVMDHCL